MEKPRRIDLYAGVFIPRKLLEDPNLPLAAKLLYGCIDGLGKSERGCFASSAYLGTIAGIKKRQVRNHLAALEKAGYIRRSNRGQIRTLQTVASIALDAAGGRQNNAVGGGSKSPPDRIDDKLNTPHTPQGGTRRRRKVKLGKEDYDRGF